MQEIVKTNIRVILSIWFMVIAMSMPLTIKAIASENKEYSIDNAEFNISFTEDGDAYVEEIWTLTFQSGEFSRFYKEIYKKNLNDLEEFSDIEIVNAYGANVNTTTYEDKTLIEWRGNFKNETKEFNVKYLLKDAVKRTDRDRAVFCYRIIGDNFTHDIDRVKVNITPLNENQAIIVNYTYPEFTDLKKNETETGTSTGSIFSTETLHSGTNKLHKINIAMNVEYFNIDSLKYLSSEEIQRQQESNSSIIMEDIVGIVMAIICFIILPACFILLPIAITLQPIIADNNMKKKLKKNPNLFNESMGLIESLNENPLIMEIVKTKKPTSKIVRTEILHLIHSRKLEYNSSNDTLIIKNMRTTTYESTFIYEIYTKCKINENTISIRYLEEFIKENKDELRELVATTLRQLISELEMKYEHNKKVTDAIKFINWYVDKYSLAFSYNSGINNFIPTEITYKDLIIQSAISYTALSIVKNTRLWSQSENLETLLDLLSDEIQEDIDVEYPKPTSSSSNSGGCSSCSSCSSCSGCGGGGAD